MRIAKTKTFALPILFATLLLLACLLPKAIRTDAAETEKVRENIYIGNIYVGGMTRSEVTAAMDDYMSKLADTKITLKGDHGNLDTTAEEIGLTWDESEIIDDILSIGSKGNLVQRFKEIANLQYESMDYAIDYTVDLSMASFVLQENEADLIDATVDWGLTREDGEFVMIEGKEGTKINVDASIQAVIDYLNSGWDGGDVVVDLVTEVAQPQGSREELAMVTDVLGTYTTDFGTKKNGRYYNVINGASLIDGTVVYPGETFSVYQTISPFTEENGYQNSTGYEGGAVVDTVGGGICQVSTTLYNAILLSELPIADRSSHSMLVSYVEPSMDAAIAGDYKDMKFENNLEYPVYLDASWSNGKLTFTVYGHESRDEGHKVEFEPEIISQEPAGLTVNVDETQPVGYVSQEQAAYPATVARLWKIIYENGTEVERKVVNNSNYISSNKIITVGTATDDPNIKNAVNAAIATNDETTIMSTVRTYAGSISGSYANTVNGQIYNSGSTPEQVAAEKAAAEAAAAAAGGAEGAATTEATGQ